MTLQAIHQGLGLEGLTVYLRDCDPDDPSANNTVVDGPLAGGDNRYRRCSNIIRRVAWTARTSPALISNGK